MAGRLTYIASQVRNGQLVGKAVVVKCGKYLDSARRGPAPGTP